MNITLESESECLAKSEQYEADYGYTPYSYQNLTWKEEDYNYDTSLWRIVRINEDGSVRLISEDTPITTEDIEYYGECHGTTDFEDTNAKSKLDEWYSGFYVLYSGKNIDIEANVLSSSTGFCSDVSIASSYQDPDYEENWGMEYGAHDRLKKDNPTPQFLCPSDLYISNVALLSADEAVYAGINPTQEGASNSYLVNNTNWYTMSYDDYFYLACKNVFSVNESGNLGSNEVTSYDNFGLRPVINVKGNLEVELTGTGNPGTSTNPYIIKPN